MDIRRIKKNYELGMIGWTKEFIKRMVAANMLTAEQYQEITGEVYAA